MSLQCSCRELQYIWWQTTSNTYTNCLVLLAVHHYFSSHNVSGITSEWINNNQTFFLYVCHVIVCFKMPCFPLNKMNCVHTCIYSFTEMHTIHLQSTRSGGRVGVDRPDEDHLKSQLDKISRKSIHLCFETMSGFRYPPSSFQSISDLFHICNLRKVFSSRAGSIVNHFLVGFLVHFSKVFKDAP